MFITGNDGGILDVNIDYINAAFLVMDDAWVPTLKIGNYSGTKTKDLGSGAVSINTITTDISKSISHKQLTDNMAIITTSTAHGFSEGDYVTISGINATFNGSYYIADVPTTTTFMYVKVASDVAYGADTGTALVTNESRDTLTLSVPYADAYAYAGFVDPGTWDLYATKGNETVYIASGNLSLKLGAVPTPTYTLDN